MELSKSVTPEEEMPRAVVATEIGDWNDVLRLQDIELDEPSGAVLKIRVLATGLCFPDVLTVQGKHIFKKSAPFVPANEVAGQVIGLGDDVSGRFKIGDIVFGTTFTGGLCEEALMLESGAYKVPSNVDPTLLAGFEVNYGTAYHGLVDLARIKEGETVLILGCSGGVGMAALDLSKALGAKCVACCSTNEKLEYCRRAGADILINYATAGGGNFKTALKDAGVYGSIDIVFDPVGGKWSEPALRALGFGGRFIVIGFAAGGANPKDAIPKLALNLALVGH